MFALYEEPWFTFRFADDRLITRFHLEGVPEGRLVSLHELEPETGRRLGFLVRARVGKEGWVDLSKPIVVRRGEGFVAVLEPG